MQNPLISIIVPVYNVEKYIERCFNSLINVDYENIECVFIDDCSPDNSRKILEELIKKHEKQENFFIVKHSQNQGLPGARNSGIKQAKGDYVFFLDSDDEITSTGIGDLVEVLQKNPNSEIIQGNVKQIPAAGNDWYDISKMRFPQNCENPSQIKRMFFTFPRVPVNAVAKLILREFLVENDLFFKEKILNEDEEWSYRVAKHIKSISFSSKLCYLRYMTPNSIMQQGDLSGRIESRLQIFDGMLDNLDDEIAVMQIRFIDSLMQNLLCDIKSNKKYIGFVKKYKEIYAKLRLLKKKYPLAYFPNKLYLRMKIKQVCGNKLSEIIRKILHRNSL